MLVLAAILRLWGFPFRYSFDPDSLRDALVAIGSIFSHQIPLTGPFSSLGPFTFGPWYFYQLIVAQLLFPIPYAPWISMTIISILFVYVMYKIGTLFKGEWFGCLLAFLAAVSPMQIGTATSLSNLNPIPFLSAVSLYLFLKYTHQRLSFWWLVLWGVCLGIGINDHYQMAGLLLLVAYICFPFSFSRIKDTSIVFLSIAVTAIPLFIFNYSYHWYTVRGMIDTTVYVRRMTYVPNSWKIYLQFWTSLWSSMIGVPSALGIALGILVGIVLFWVFIKKQYTKQLLIVFIVFFINFYVLRFYWGTRHEVYLLYLSPFIFTLLGFSLYTLTKTKIGKIASVCIVSLIFFFALKITIPHLKADEYNLAINKKVDVIEKQFPHTKFSLYKCLKTKENVTNSEALLIVLLERHLLSEKGKKIGTKSFNCSLRQEQEKDLFSLVGDTDIVYFKSVSDIKLKQLYWEQITPVSRYNQIANWWK